MRRRLLLGAVAGSSEGELLPYSYSGISWDIGTEDDSMRGISARRTSSKLDLVGASSESLWSYDKDGTNPNNEFSTTGLTTPQGVLFVPSLNKYWISDNAAPIYTGFTIAGALSGMIDTSNEMVLPKGGDIDLEGNYWMADGNLNRLFKYTSGFVYTTTNFPTTSGLTGVAHDDASGTLWTTDGANQLIERDKAGVLTGNSVDLTLQSITTAEDVAYDPFEKNTLWVVDRGTDKVYKYIRQ